MQRVAKKTALFSYTEHWDKKLSFATNPKTKKRFIYEIRRWLLSIQTLAIKHYTIIGATKSRTSAQYHVLINQGNNTIITVEFDENKHESEKHPFFPRPSSQQREAETKAAPRRRITKKSHPDNKSTVLTNILEETARDIAAEEVELPESKTQIAAAPVPPAGVVSLTLFPKPLTYPAFRFYCNNQGHAAIQYDDEPNITFASYLLSDAELNSFEEECHAERAKLR